MPNVSELQNSSPVFVDGFKVGIVNSIRYEYDNPHSNNILVQISLDKNMKLQTGSYVELKSGLTSGAYLDMKLNKDVSTYCHVGDTITGIARISLIDKISTEYMPQIENILPRLDSILSGIQMLINHPALTRSLEQIERTTKQMELTTVHLQKSSKQLNVLLSNEVPVILSNLDKVSSDFTVVSENLKGLNLQGTLSTVDNAIQNVDQMTKQLNNPDSSLGLLLKDRNLYDHLDSTALNASKLLQDIRERPKRYVRFSIF
jgi:phospholipid/cholesterol/gamma-HCH transport system substrate-binding protein